MHGSGGERVVVRRFLSEGSEERREGEFILRISSRLVLTCVVPAVDSLFRILLVQQQPSPTGALSVTLVPSPGKEGQEEHHSDYE